MLTFSDKVKIALCILALFVITSVRPAHAEGKMVLSQHEAKMMKQYISGLEVDLAKSRKEVRELREKLAAQQDCVREAIKNKTMLTLCFGDKEQ